MANDKNSLLLPTDRSSVTFFGPASVTTSDARPEPGLMIPEKRLAEFGQLMHRAIERRLARQNRTEKTD